MTIFVLRFCVCWTAEFPELKNGKNGQNVIESASITKYAYNAYLGTLQYSKKIDPARLYKMISNLICGFDQAIEYFDIFFLKHLK